MSKSRQAGAKKSDQKPGQPKISMFFKQKPVVANQEATTSKYTQIRSSSEIVIETPERALVRNFGKESKEDDDLDIIPDTPQQHRIPKRLFTNTNSRAPCSSPEPEVIPPTPPRPGRQNKPGTSLAYKFLKRKCNIKSIQSTELLYGSFPTLETKGESAAENFKPLESPYQKEAAKDDLPSDDDVFYAAPANTTSLGEESKDYDDPDIIPDTPQQHRTAQRLFTDTNSRAHFSSPEPEVIPPTPPRVLRENKPGVSFAYNLLKRKCENTSIRQTDLLSACLPSDKCLPVTNPACTVASDCDLPQTIVCFDSNLLENGLNAKPNHNQIKSTDSDDRAAKRQKFDKSCIENIPPSCHMPAPTLETREKPVAEAAEDNVPEIILFDDDEFWEEFADCAETANPTSKENVIKEKYSNNKRVNDESHDTLPIRKYNRHVVKRVIRDNSDETVLMVSPIECDSTIRTCVLRGFWIDTQVSEGDIVNVLGDFDADGTVVIGGDQKDNLLVVNPDLLVSSTTVVSGVYCRRKAVLKEWFRGVDARSINMLVGILVHQLFQEAAEQRLTTPQEVRRLLADITSRTTNLQEIYGFQGDKEYARLHSDLESFVKPVGEWIQRHVVGNGQPPVGAVSVKYRGEQAIVDVKQILDIEENVWCPRLGLKGKLDMVIQTQSDKVVPLELKTGRPTFSAEHEGQVTLYRMMGRDRRPKETEGNGLLLYLKTAECREVQHKEQAQQQLVQMRNEIAWHVAKPIAVPERPSDEVPSSTLCSVLCARENEACRNGELPSVYRSAVEHLTKVEPCRSSVDYFFKWCHNVFTEDLCTKNALQLRDVWCETSRKREERGECFSGMVLKSFTDAGQKENIHRFERCASHRNEGSLTTVGLERTQSVVVSVEKRHLLALSTGYIKDVQQDYVDVALDRNLYSKGEYVNDVFRIDANNFQMYSITALSNLARLMFNTEISTRLRGIIVGHEPLVEKLQMTRAMGTKAKPFIGDLNRLQKIALLMSLATKDYMLIEGTPGSGKTKTVVAIVRMLLHMRYTVLLASHTHSAVDNVLLKLKEKGNGDFIRLGKMERVHPELVDHTSERLLNGLDSLEKMNAVFNSKLLVATTCLGSNHAVFQHRKEFDYCIIDEATQILQPVCLGPLFLCKRFILVGDSQQLPPIVRSLSAKKGGMDESLFALLKSKEGNKGEDQSLASSRHLLLSEQYRMNEEIMRFSNVLSYDGKLACGGGNRQAVLELPKLDEVASMLPCDSFLTRVASVRLEESVLFLNTDRLQALEEKDSRGKICSRIEAEITLEIVAFFLQCGLNVNQVGVISPYRNQVALIKKVLAQKKNDVPQQFSELSEVEVNTIDQYQGREKEAVIISFAGKSKAGSGKSDQEILSDKRRINVAITRAKSKLLLVGSREVLGFYEPLKQLLGLLHDNQIINLTHECVSAFRWPLKVEESIMDGQHGHV